MWEMKTPQTDRMIDMLSSGTAAISDLYEMCKQLENQRDIAENRIKQLETALKDSLNFERNWKK